MDSLAEVLLLMLVVIVVGCLAWGALETVRVRARARDFAERLEAALPDDPDADLLRVRTAVDQLRRDVGAWDRGERP